MDPSRRDQRADTVVLCAIWLAGAALLASFAGADVSGLDAGEIGGAAWNLGVAHPTGFPLDMMLLRAAALVPLGPLAFRQNVGVALIGASAITAAAALCLRACAQSGVRDPESRGVAAGLCAAYLVSSATFLRSALAVEVYSTALTLSLLSAAAACAGQARRMTPLLGFGLGAHVTAPMLTAPLWLHAFWGMTRRRRWQALSGVCMGALTISYLPLASRRLTAFDWGHPSSLHGLLRHLSAERIREAYAPELFGLDPSPRHALLLQLAEAPFVLACALLGLAVLFVRARASAWICAWLLTLDLAYATWINPMGIAERQVGHASTALVCVLAGVASGLVFERVRAKSSLGMRGLGLALGSWAVLQVTHADWPEGHADGHAVAERFASGSPLTELPSRAVYVCQSDSACASALFAVYAEAARPDLAVVPAQHLWDASVLRRLRGLALASQLPGDEPPPRARGDLAQHNLLQLMAARRQRPVFFESLPAPAPALDAQRAPLLRGATSPGASQLDALVRARFGAAGPRTQRARELWSSAYEQLGLGYLRVGDPAAALSALERSLVLTPNHAPIHSNLGVAFERAGQLMPALQHMTRAVQLGPRRVTPWVNLVRLLLLTRGPEAARAALAQATVQGISDPRLEALARELGARDVAQGTTRK